jgi:hypothetical protein
MPTLPSPSTTTGAGVVPYAGGSASGVAMVVPPEYVLPSITAAVNRAMAAVPADRTGALVTIFTPKGANLALAQRVGDHVKVTAWVGKTWAPKPGEPGWDYGAAATVTW